LGEEKENGKEGNDGQHFFFWFIIGIKYYL
jgi:hypothetical protein